jgi:ubiquinone/menaquinone biosynthesis C-methylase UbiE
VAKRKENQLEEQHGKPKQQHNKKPQKGAFVYNRIIMNKPKKDTSWGNVATWYAEHVASEDSYHQKVILPNLTRLLALSEGKRVLDVACGSGFFANEFHKAGAEVRGLDISPELIALAKEHANPAIGFIVAPAHAFPEIKNASVDIVTVILAIQNIAEVKEMLEECSRVLVPNGKMYIVMNHPAFRIPKASSWGFDEVAKKQYRRIDQYLTEIKIPIAMHPGADPSEETVSFHRPLQYYMKLIGNTGFAVTRLEEWISHRISEQGPRRKEEDRMRKEIPLFMMLELKKLNDTSA